MTEGSAKPVEQIIVELEREIAELRDRITELVWETT